MGYFDASHSSLVNMQKVAIKLGLVSEGHFRIPAKSDDEAPTTEMSMLDGLAAEEVMINDAEVNNVQQEVEAAEEEAVKEESAEAAAIPGLLLTKQKEAVALAAAAAARLEGPDLACAALDLQRETAAKAAAADGASARQLKKRRKPVVSHNAQQRHDELLYAACEAMDRHGFEPGHLSPPALEAWAASAQGRSRYEQLSYRAIPYPAPDPYPNRHPNRHPSPYSNPYSNRYPGPSPSLSPSLSHSPHPNQVQTARGAARAVSQRCTRFDAD